MTISQNSYSEFLRILKTNTQLNDRNTKIKNKYYNAFHRIQNTVIIDSKEQPKDESDFQEYVRIRLKIESYEANTYSRVLYLSSDDLIPPMSPYEQSFFTNRLIELSAYLVPAINSSKLTSGTSLRNVRLSEEAYSAPELRSVIVDDVTYIEGLSTANYAIYKNETTRTIIIAFRGTSNYRDVLTDATLTAGYTTDQRFTDSRNIYETIKANLFYNSWTVETTGHSLGGALGLYLNNLYGIKADVFDPAIGVGLFLNNPNKNNASAHIVKGDIVSPLIFKNNVVNNLFIYPVENLTYGYYGYHLRSNFYTPP